MRSTEDTTPVKLFKCYCNVQNLPFTTFDYSGKGIRELST